ncbi:MAG: hypothetical protein SNJ75_01725 [Gemmataceae bacterium]
MVRRFTFVLGVMFFLGIALTNAQTPPTAKKADPVPPNTIVAVYDSLAEALKKVPRAILLTPEQYQQMLDEIERLKKLTETPRLRVPSKCQISGKIEGNLALLTVKFELDTEQPATQVRLGFGQGSATGVRLGGRTPTLVNDTSKNSNGFVVEVDRPGDHSLELDLVVPLTARPGGVGLLLDLPRAAITSLELTLPPNSREIRLGGKTPAESRLSVQGNLVKSDSLGPLDRLDLVWRSAQNLSTGPILAAEGVIHVRVEAKQTTTEALLNLRVLGGQTRQWPLLVPSDAEISVEAAQSDRIERIDPPGTKGPRLIRLKSESTEPLKVRVRHRTNTPRPGTGKLSIGPFAVVGAASHTGQVLIHNNVPEYHLDMFPTTELRRRAPTEEENRKDPQLVSVFSYGPATPTTAWLELEPDTVRGQLKIRSNHTLRLADDGDPGPAWLVETELTVTPRWAEVDRVVVSLPVGCEWLSDDSYPLPDRVRSLSYDPAQRQVLFRLNRATETTPFKVRLTCRVPGEVDLGRIGLALLPLPRPTAILEPDSSLRVVVPPRVRAVPADKSSGLELVRQTSHELVYRCPRRPPDRVAVAWGPFRPEIQVERIVDVTLGASNRVRHELIFTLPPGETSPMPQRVRLSPLLVGRLMIRQGEARIEGDSLSVPLRGESQARVVLDYDLPAEGEQCLLPLLTPEQSDRLETRVRLWSEAGRLPAAVPAQWSEGHIEPVAHHDRLPVMVLTSTNPLSTLALSLQTQVSPSRVLIDRALVRVDLSEDGTQDYRVRYRLARLSEPYLDLELPGLIASLGLQVSLEGKGVEPLPLVADRPELKGRLVRLKLAPELLREGAILECTYQLSLESSQANLLATPLALPRIRDENLDFPTRWQIQIPDNRLVLRPELGGPAPRVWKRSGWLFLPALQVSSAELEQWLTDGPVVAAELEAEQDTTTSVLLWRGAESNLTLSLVPRQGWLLVCSAVLVLLMLFLMRLVWGNPEGHTSPWFWPVLLALLSLALVIGVFLPHLGLQILYGIQPALVVLALLVPIGWALAERKRRQVVFLANFRRSSSSLTKNPAEVQGSTVDALPRPVGSVLDRSGGES